jgi:hypothetical protein
MGTSLASRFGHDYLPAFANLESYGKLDIDTLSQNGQDNPHHFSIPMIMLPALN